MRAPLLLVLACSAFGQLPEVMAPPGNPPTRAKIALGKALFWEEQLSVTATVACGTCHRPEVGGSDPRVALHPGPDGLTGTLDDRFGSPGVPGGVTPRRPRSVIGAAFGFELFWDGRAGERFEDPLSGETVLRWGGSLETQSLVPILHPAEMGREGWNWDDVTQRLEDVRPLGRSPRVPGRLARWIGERGYPALFEEAFGDAAITPVRIALAIASYERTLVPDRTPVVLNPGGGPGWTALEREGLRLFNALTCATCHTPDEGLFTDQAYHYLGTSPRSADAGLEGVTGLAADRGRVLTPSLLGVGLRGRFFHDGSAASLEEVIDFYDRGGEHEPNEIGRLDLTDDEKAALVAFLGRPLTDPRLEARTPPFDRPLLSIEPDAEPVFAAGVFRLEDGGLSLTSVLTWRRQAGERDPGPGDFLPVEFDVPDRPELVGRTFEATWIGPLGGEGLAPLRVRLSVSPPRTP